MLLVFLALPQCLSLGVTDKKKISTWKVGGWLGQSWWGAWQCRHPAVLVAPTGSCLLGRWCAGAQRAVLLCLLQPWPWVFVGDSPPCTSPRLLPWFSPATPALNLEFKPVLCH